jgi:hypothetical protein
MMFVYAHILVQISLFKNGNWDSIEQGIKKFFGEPGFGKCLNVSNSRI